MEDVLEFRRVLRQRNKILSDAKGTDCANLLLPWNETLLRYGIRITQKRRVFVEEFIPYIIDAFLKIVGERETPGITYAPIIPLNPELSEEENINIVRKKLEKRYRDELRFGTTLVGPHRDELMFTLNDLQLKHFASQGQHKTFLVALKIAEFFYLKERCNETPIFLLDDIFSELDEHRSQKLLSLIEKLGQTFITATSEKIFGGANWSNEKKKFHISNGQVINSALAA
jgi:DNA replication and repair protein RecF